MELMYQPNGILPLTPEQSGIYDIEEKVKYRVDSILVSKPEMLYIIQLLASRYPRPENQNTDEGAQKIRMVYLQRLEQWWLEWVYKYYDQLKSGIAGTDGYDPKLMQEFGLSLARATPADIQRYWKEIVPSIKSEFLLSLDASDQASWKMVLLGRQRRSAEDSYVLGIRQDVFTAAFEAIAVTAVVVGGAATVGPAILGQGSAGAVEGSAFQASTYAGTIGGTSSVTAGYSAAEIAAVSGTGAGVSTAVAGTGILASIESMLPAGAVESAKAALGVEAAKGLKNLINPQPKNVDTGNVTVPMAKDNFAIWLGLAGSILLFFV